MLPPVAAEIVWDKSVNVAPAPNFWYGPILGSDTQILAFVEKQGVVMPSGRLEVQRLNQWDDIEGMDTRELGGARIDSHMVYFDKATKGLGRVTLSAEVEFSDRIVGFVADDRLFAVTNPWFAPNPTHQEAPRWSLEEKSSGTPLDVVTLLSPTRIRLQWTNESATDALRVFTSRDALPASALQVTASGITGAAQARLLFVGSSSAYWNDLPREVAKAVDYQLAMHPNVPVVPEIVGRSGSDIRVYLEPDFARYEYGVEVGQTFLDKLRVERPELVVLMTVARFIMGDNDPTGTGDLHRAAITRYCAEIRAGGGEPVFYEVGWGRGERETEGRERIFELAVANRIRHFSPCSSAWARVYAERPDLRLQHPKDSVHPGDLGHYLNVACFYAALTQESPVGRLPRTFWVWPHGLAKPETAAERAAEAARIAAFQPDAYQSRLPKSMHGHMSMNLTATVDVETARYLETVAWETWQALDHRLKRRLAAEH
ncbi:MAG: hypothetical protein O2960_24475 [Verrucomicrobia bacterium]|nr:hypothetical protein [Verrucomicrobiota bacterium]